MQRGGDYVAAVVDSLPSAVTSKLLGIPSADLERVQRWAMQAGAMVAGVITHAELTALARAAAEHSPVMQAITLGGVPLRAI